MNSLGTTPYISTTERENKDVNYQNLETSQPQSIDSSLYNRGDQDVFSLSQLKHVAPSSNISGMAEPSPLTNSSQSSGFFNGEETKPLLSDYTKPEAEQKPFQSSTFESPTSFKSDPPEIKDDKGESTSNYLSSNPTFDKVDITPPKISEDTVISSTNDKNKDYGTNIASSSIAYKPSTTPSKDTSQVVATGEGATKTLKQVGHIIQSQAQTMATSIRNNVNSDNILNILINSFLVIVIAVLLYFGIW
ncbi:predicted protein [Naegleria gruberi]|uniref:Predicted protein n=1 Tax=Naegleria gruberi TaxID=5762 RepID=D2VPL7_NAEGR|nr:uncharacterized protein NAEGRDRAFT_70908 [Naegleria gruberi]EFC41146.1 predicted protein [Naegleria gruberi]|eukprot:XP_002673890.1 predicted protein [Naegleria gruberi strain NEG-M]